MKKNIPVLFQTLSDIEISDTRFTKVKIWLMHLEENFNGSYFDKEAVSKAIPSLSNTPIMGMIDKDSEDFTDHAIDIEFDDNGDYKQTHLTVPFGVIPSDNNATFEGRVGDDGVTRTYLTVEGLLWNKWEDAVNILKSNAGQVGQSMEIVDVEGEFKDDGYFSITDFKFDGACLLGNGVEPAMINSTVELASHETVAEVIREKLGVYTRYTTHKGGNKVEDKTKEFEEQKNAKKNSEDTKDNGKVDSKEDAKTEPKQEPKKEIPDAEAKKNKDKKAEPKKDIPEPEVKSDKDDKGKEESNDEGKVEADDKEKGVLSQIIISDKVYTKEDVEKLLEIEKSYNELLTEMNEAAIDDLIKTYAQDLSDDEVEELKELTKGKEYDEAELSVFAYIGRKAYASKKKEDTPKVTEYAKVNVSNKESNDEPYGGIIKKAK